MSKSKIVENIKNEKHKIKIIEHQQLYKLYSIDKYAGKTNKFIENEYDEFTLNELEKILKNDNGYHFRIIPGRK